MIIEATTQNDVAANTDADIFDAPVNTGATENGTEKTGAETTGTERSESSTIESGETTGAVDKGIGGIEKKVDGPSSVSLTPDQLRELVSGLQQKPVAAGEVAKKMTPEEIDKQLNVFRANEEMITKVLQGGPEAVKAMQAIVDGVARHAVTVANIINKQELEQHNQRINPYIQFAQEVQAQQARANYLSTNPTHEGLEPLVEQVSRQMMSEKFAGSQKQVFAEVAKRVEALATTLKIPRANASGAGASDAATEKQKSTSRMSTVSAGGQGGAGSPISGDKSKDSEAAIWD